MVKTGTGIRPSSAESRDYRNLLQLIVEESSCTRDANRTDLVVGGLVRHIVSQWRESFCKTVVQKYNCFFLMPFIHEFQRYMRNELARIYAQAERTDAVGPRSSKRPRGGSPDADFCEALDLSAARRALSRRRESLLKECAAYERSQEKFDEVHRMMQRTHQ